MGTYIDGQRVAYISNELFLDRNGRFALNNDAFCLFGSTNAAAMPGIQVLSSPYLLLLVLLLLRKTTISVVSDALYFWGVAARR
jgi:hypothetical protein